jgi:peptidoglycan/xylan/chitin deacetylase (PgdA/CDA1 family)/predicted O-methyltransferase YrrM
MRIPILTYQPMYIHGNEYARNHLQALRSDVEHLTHAGFRIVPLRTLVDTWLERGAEALHAKVVALACDDSADFGYRDLPHPGAGTQRSVVNILRDFAARNPGRQPDLHVTSFEIASPQARTALDAACMLGRGWWSDDWWPEAVASGFMHIGNHSWDHNHASLPDSFAAIAKRGGFAAIDRQELADHEIRQAAEYLRRRAPNPGTGLFAYPYGESNAYLAGTYLPARGAELGIMAAFTGRAGFWEAASSRWEIPRFVCGRDWSSPDELGAILRAASGDARTWSPMLAQSRGADAYMHAFAAFVQARVEAIPGWLHPEAALLTAHLARAQAAMGIAGPTLELGVFKGKYLAVLYRLSDAALPVVGVDLFVGATDKAAAASAVKANIVAACGDDARLRIVVADSMELTATKLAEAGGASGFRFVSVDAGHTRELVLRDLETAAPLLRPGGIMALDDAFNFGTPGVIEGIAEFFFRYQPALAPFAQCYNKLFVTTPDFHARYLREAEGFLEAMDGLQTCARTRAQRAENRTYGFVPKMFGYEIVPFVM